MRIPSTVSGDLSRGLHFTDKADENEIRIGFGNCQPCPQSNWRRLKIMKIASTFRIVITLLVALVVLGSVPAFGAGINVLWYTGGVDDGSGTYQALSAASVPGDAVTFWSGGAMPTGTFNVLVIASPEGGWSPYPDYTALTSAHLSFSTSSRLMLTGQDADWHNINFPGPVANGPAGFLSDSINWAGNGTGMGLVALGMTGDAASCYGGPILGLSGYTGNCNATNNVVIPTAFASFPINTGLTSAGLSNWDTAAHTGFTGLDTSIWTGINVDGTVCGPTGPCSEFVTIVTQGGTGGIGTPEPGTLVMFGSGIIGLAGLVRRKLML
jgi:hypothetical protein